ncbi:MAG: hypothetical protein LRS49_05710, partial [Desulfurococcales archaeon]|nr:hypothetical protein [Desulfurococcales archaeon]
PLYWLEAIKTLLGEGVVRVYSPAGFTVYPRPGPISGDEADWLYTLAAKTKQDSGGGEVKHAGFPAEAKFNARDAAGKKVLRVEVPLALDRGDYVIVAPFSYNDNDDSDKFPATFNVTLVAPDGTRIAGQAIPEDEQGEGEGWRQVVATLTAHTPQPGTYTLRIDVENHDTTLDDTTVEADLVLYKVVAAKILAPSGACRLPYKPAEDLHPAQGQANTTRLILTFQPATSTPYPANIIYSGPQGIDRTLVANSTGLYIGGTTLANTRTLNATQGAEVAAGGFGCYGFGVAWLDDLLMVWMSMLASSMSWA